MGRHRRADRWLLCRPVVLTGLRGAGFAGPAIELSPWEEPPKPLGACARSVWQPPTSWPGYPKMSSLKLDGSEPTFTLNKETHHGSCTRIRCFAAGIGTRVAIDSNSLLIDSALT